MRVTISADDGDEIAVVSDQLSAKQSVVRMELRNPSYDEAGDFDWVILSPGHARQLAHALIRASALIEGLPSGRIASHSAAGLPDVVDVEFA